MQGFLVTSIVASVVLTLVLNLLPRLFPDATRKAEARMHQRAEEAFREQEAGGSRLKVFVPWKAMLFISVGLTVLVNLVGAITG